MELYSNSEYSSLMRIMLLSSRDGEVLLDRPEGRRRTIITTIRVNRSEYRTL